MTPIRPGPAPYAPALPVHADPETEALCDSGLPHELAYAFGGPFHFLLPHRFDANVAAFRAVLDALDVRGRLYYAKKANKAAAWIERCAAMGVGVDVASVGELRQALGHGVRGPDLVVTGPAKADELLRLARAHQCLITVDAPDELERLLALGPQGPSPRVLLRVLPPGSPPSRFGMTTAELDAALRRCVRAGADLCVVGFSFHLTGYAIGPRAALAAQLIRLCAHARAMGLPADRISVGGGFAVDYVPHAAWRDFLATQRPTHYHAGKVFTAADFYPYHSPTAGPAALRALLTTVPPGRTKTLADLLREAGLTLLLEPGRALLDRAGCTVFRVQGVKDRPAGDGAPAPTDRARAGAGQPTQTDGYGILTVDGTSLSLSEQWFNSEFAPDPVLITPRGRARPGQPYPACVAGASCLESDVLTWRKILFPARPAIGDLLVYPNTAGYQMDSNESPFHDLALPPKVVIEPAEGPPRWRLDRRPAS
ncbi:Y4yA family PLP-dependent enzyme [Streptomyces sp. NPDC057702]|uniref:Y4yA family PLP-dependent enzyme n=1 Tax=unclassified Streptomyces TaxID=2593676 RepID=UPI0036B05CB5